MRKFWMCVLVVMISLGVVAVMGGCGGGGGGGGLPKSTATYEGPNMPAVIDSTMALDLYDLPYYIGDFLDTINGLSVMTTSVTIPGSESGTVRPSVPCP